MTKLSMLGAAIAALALPAFATGAIAAAPDSTGDSWEGAYLGAQVGYGWGRDNIHDEERSSPGFSDYSDHFSLDGATGGIFIGCNWQDGPWVFGTEGDAELSGVNGDNRAWPFGTNMTAEIAGQISLRGRLGYEVDDSVLYATGGLALGDIETHYYDGSAQDHYSNWQAGWTVGAGIEHAFSPEWVGRIEYRYADFGRVTDWTRNTDFGWNEHNDITENAVRVGIAYRL